jgi:selenocysteine lyase/cysteine desulfurase
MTTETEKSPREIALELVEQLKRIPEVTIYRCCENDVIDTIEKALCDRDERAAKIAEQDSIISWAGGSTGDAKGTAKRIASAIRGKSNG